MKYQNQKLKDLIALLEINNAKILEHENSINTPPFMDGVINKLKAQNIEILNAMQTI